ncbi:MAG: FAD:protein FMN transferase [Acidiferrobacterales bacterium]
MGTTYTVKVADPPADLNPDELKATIERVLEKVNDQMSTYRVDSELSKLNSNTSIQWIDSSADLLTVVEEALRVSRLTDGAFDVTVGPLVNLWGFGPGKRANRVPSQQQISQAMSRVGYTKLSTRRSPPAIKKTRSDVSIDLSAIAKGYGVDKVAERLESLAVHNYMVEIGGDLRAKGHNLDGTPWKIGIEKPIPGPRAVQLIIQLQDKGMATSGDYRNFFEKDGQRFSHTINPRKGTPVTHNLVSVTVLSPTAMGADAMATALLVMGPETGFALAERERLAAYFISRAADDEFVDRSTSRFKQSIAH